MKLCTCQNSIFEKDLEPKYTSYQNTNRCNNFSTKTEYSKLNSKIANVKIQDFIINKENSDPYSNYINLNKSEYFFNGNEIGSFSSYNINNSNPTKNIISVKNGANNKKYVVKIKLYGNQIDPEEFDNNSIKYKKYTSNVNKSKKSMKNNYSFKNITMPYDINNNTDYYYNNNTNNRNIGLKKIHGLMTGRINHRIHVQTLNPNIKNNNNEEENNSKMMNDQEILDYLNTNNTEKKNLIKKILNKKLEHDKEIKESKKFNNKKKIYLDNSGIYNYKNDNYNYLYDRQTSTSTSYINNIPDSTNTYKYYESAINQKIIINKKHSLRPCNSNEVIPYRENKKEYNTKIFNNNNSSNHIKKLKKVKSYNNMQYQNDNDNDNDNTNIYPPKNKLSKIKNKYNQGPKRILLNNKNKLKNSVNTNRITKRQKDLYLNNKNTLTVISTNINKKNEISNELNIKIEKKNPKVIIGNRLKHRKSNSFGVNTNIEESKENKENDNKIYIINKTVNERFNKTKEESNSNLEFSVQSINDSKMMELAKNFIKQEDNLNHNEINEILNCKKN